MKNRILSGVAAILLALVTCGATLVIDSVWLDKDNDPRTTVTTTNTDPPATIPASIGTTASGTGTIVRPTTRVIVKTVIKYITVEDNDDHDADYHRKKGDKN